MAAHVVAAVGGRIVDQRRMRALLLAANPRKRADSRRTWAALVAVFVNHADWSTGAITAAHATLGAEAGARCGRRPFSHDTVALFVKDAVAAGVLVCPDGLGGRSRRAMRGTHNQCPTYFVIDPAGVDLRTPPSHVSGTVQLGDAHPFYKGPIRPKFPELSTRDAPATGAERRAAAEWLRARLLVGAVPAWQLTAMLAEHFKAGLSPAEVFRRVCHAPDGTVRSALPYGAAGLAAELTRSPHPTAARMLLGIIGHRLGEWRGIAPPARPAARRPTSPVPPIGPRTRPPGVALAYLAAAGLRAGTLR